MVGRYGVKKRNGEVEFVKMVEMPVVNTYFRKREEH